MIGVRSRSEITPAAGLPGDNRLDGQTVLFYKDLARFLCDYSSDDLRVQSSGDMSGSFLQ